jgi:hypothetical protein
MSMTTDNPSTTAIEYNYIQGSATSTWGSVEANRINLISSNGTIKNLLFQITTAPGGGKTRTITLNKNTTPTALTCTITDPATSCSDLVNSVSVSAGDLLSVSTTPSGTPTNPGVNTWSMIFSSTTAKESLISNQSTTGFSTTLTRYAPIFGTWGASNATENLVQQVMPTSGTFKNLRASISVAPGSGKSSTFTVSKNVTPTALTCTISDAATTCTDLLNSFTFVAGDLITLQSVPSGTPSAAATVNFSVTFLADVDGESVSLSTITSSPSTSAVNYMVKQAGLGNVTATELNVKQNSNAMTVKNIYVAGVVAPGGSASYTYTLKKGTADTALACTITGAATTCNAATDILVSANDLLYTSTTPASTPAGPAGLKISYLNYIAPASTNGYGGVVMQGVTAQGMIFN